MNNSRLASIVADSRLSSLSTSASTSARLAGGASLLAALSLAFPGGALAATPTPVTQTFESTGAQQEFTVPAGVTSVHVQAIGAAGEPGLVEGFDEERSLGGLGAEVSGELPVSPGEVLYVEVADGTWGGGAGGRLDAGAGGGASDVRTVSSSVANPEESLDSRVIVAGGGGGGGSAWEGVGGSGGDADSPGGIGVGAERFIEEGGQAVGAGGGPGTLTGGGETSEGCGAGADGSLASGGEGGEGIDRLAGGGGGGGGYYGGAGGSGSCNEFDPGEDGAGGGGGGGSSYTADDVKSTAFGLVSTATAPSVIISYATPATATPGASTITFPGVQPQGTVSAPQTITLTNTGGTSLRLSSVTFGDSAPALETDHPEDFLVDPSGCLGEVAFEQSCNLTVRFAPQGAGTRTATLQIAGNMGAGPTTIALSGTGGALPAGEAGAAGTSGAAGADGKQGPAGPQGERGPGGYPAIYECHPRQGDGHFEVACYVRIITGQPDVSGASAAQSNLHLTLRRNGVVYARAAVHGAGGHDGLVLHAVHRVTPGRYRLVLASRHVRVSEWVTVR